MCALVKPKDIPFETQCLEKRLMFIKNLKDCLREDSRLVTATVELYSELIDEILHDVCVDVHRDATTQTHYGDPSEKSNRNSREVSSTRGLGKGVDTLSEKVSEGQRSKRRRHTDDTVADIGDDEKQETMEKMLAKAAIHYGTANMLGIQMSGSKGAVDMFGNMIQPVALDQVSCPNCGRKISSGRFAPHLEKCMGGGRLAGRSSKLPTNSVS